MELPELPSTFNVLLERYWDIAWQEGRENRTHDTPEGDAGETLQRIHQALRAYAEEAVKQERERLDAIERMGPNGTIRVDDEFGVCPRYIHWGGSTGLTLRDAIDVAIDAAAIRARSTS